VDITTGDRIANAEELVGATSIARKILRRAINERIMVDFAAIDRIRFEIEV